MSTRNRHSTSVPFFAPLIGENTALVLQPAPEAASRTIPSLDYYGASRPASNSTGDFFDFIALDSRLLASIGEAPGPGVSSPAVLTAVRAYFSGVACEGPDGLAAAGARLNRSLCEVASDGSLTTLFFACVDPLRRVLRYLSAGYESAFLFRAKSFRVRRLEPTGTVLGLTSRTVYRQRAVSLSPGDVLVAFTGGVADAVDRAGRAVGEEGVVTALKDQPDDPPRVLVERILNAVARYADGVGQLADRTVLAVRFAGSAGNLNEGHAADLAFAAA
jgi:sigma-B regulation protein RsbU (phosphoserine phosphatase)